MTLINEIKFIKGAYGFENLGTCAFSSKTPWAQKSYSTVYGYAFKSPEKRTWIAIYIPKSSRKFRENNGLPDISKFEGFIGAFQEIIRVEEPIYNHWGIDKRWDLGIPAKRLLAFKEPKIHISDIFRTPELGAFYAATTSSAAYEINTSLESFLLDRINIDDLYEVNLEKKYIDKSCEIINPHAKAFLENLEK